MPVRVLNCVNVRVDLREPRGVARERARHDLFE
jgi:hypothetical protein